MWMLLLLLACDEAPQYPMDTFQSLPMAPPDTSENTWVYVAGGPEPATGEIYILKAQVQVQEQEVDRLNRELEALLLHLKQQSTTASEKPLQ